MLKHYLACSGLAVALLFAMGGSVRADDGCPAGENAAGTPMSGAPGESMISPPVFTESIGTGTMIDDGTKKGIPHFGKRTWEDILGIKPNPDYSGPWREGTGPADTVTD